MTAEPIWRPDPDQTPRPRIADFTDFANQRTGQNMAEFDELWHWSVNDLEGFWGAVWDFFDVIADEPYTEVLADRSMPGATWFPSTRLNYAEHALRTGLDDKLADEPAIITLAESGERTETTWRDLRRQVGSVAAWLRDQGVGEGDRVVGYLPNTHHTLIAFLATASVGAIWSACAQDYAAEGAATKLGQLEPTVLFAADGYLWNGQAFDCRDQVADLANRMPSLRAMIGVGNLGEEFIDQHGQITNLTTWDDVASGDTEPEFARVDFDTPLWVLYSSGTTGIPKGIVHSHGGVVIDHLRLLGLHLDIRPGDRFFWYTNTNWMMWNLVASALVGGATTVCFDGSPLYPGRDRLWEIAADTKANVLGVSPGIFLAGMKAGIEPGRRRRGQLSLRHGCSGKLETIVRFQRDVALANPGACQQPQEIARSSRNVRVDFRDEKQWFGSEPRSASASPAWSFSPSYGAAVPPCRGPATPMPAITGPRRTGSGRFLPPGRKVVPSGQFTTWTRSTPHPRR